MASAELGEQEMPKPRWGLRMVILSLEEGDSTDATLTDYTDNVFFYGIVVIFPLKAVVYMVK